MDSGRAAAGPGPGDARGVVPVTDRYRQTDHENIYAPGVAVQVKPPEPTDVPTGVPRTGWMSEVMARVAAHTIRADITGGEHEEKPFGDIGGRRPPAKASHGMAIPLCSRACRSIRLVPSEAPPWAPKARRQVLSLATLTGLDVIMVSLYHFRLLELPPGWRRQSRQQAPQPSPRGNPQNETYPGEISGAA